jgi:hypothetical protein
MSGFEVAGVAIGIAPIVFKAVAESMRILEDTIRFDDDAEDLVIRIETAKAHLSIWATSVGLVEGELVPALHPLSDLIVRTLKRIELLVTNLEQQGNTYGLELRDATVPESKKTSAMAVQMRRSLHRVLRRSDPKRNLEVLIQAEQLKESGTSKKQVDCLGLSGIKRSLSISSTPSKHMSVGCTSSCSRISGKRYKRKKLVSISTWCKRSLM